VVEWDQPYVTGAPNSGGATSQIDVCITGASGTDEITDYNGNAATCSGPNAVGKDSYQVIIVGNPANASGNTAAENMNIQVGLAGSTAAPGRIKVVVEDDGAGSTINSFATNSGTLQGHPGAAGAAAVGAAAYYNTPACGVTPAQLDYFSSQGGDPILFDAAGNRLATPVVRQKPDFVGPDGVNNTFLGFTLASASITLPTDMPAGCANDASYPNFFGTSAATPHIAALAALMLQANPALTPAQIYQVLRDTALAMDNPSPSYNSGWGLVQADAAYAAMPQVVPAAPTVTLDSSSITVNSSATITWSSVNTTGCTASGSWSGSLLSSGSQALTPTAAGTDTYTVTCANSAGSSPATSVTLTATLPVATQPAEHSGGGGLDYFTLLALAGLGAVRILRQRPRVLT
jgi:subtilisin family serine protease